MNFLKNIIKKKKKKLPCECARKYCAYIIDFTYANSSVPISLFFFFFFNNLFIILIELFFILSNLDWLWTMNGLDIFLGSSYHFLFLKKFFSTILKFEEAQMDLREEYKVSANE